jgi:hypothetical protein
LVIAANEGAVSLHPIFISHLGIPNVVMVPIADAGATWDFFVVWQRGKTAGPLRALLDALTLKPGKLVFTVSGGSKDDRTAAREWMSMFWHEAVVPER